MNTQQNPGYLALFLNGDMTIHQKQKLLTTIEKTIPNIEISLRIDNNDVVILNTSTIGKIVGITKDELTIDIDGDKKILVCDKRSAIYLVLLFKKLQKIKDIDDAIDVVHYHNNNCPEFFTTLKTG